MVPFFQVGNAYQEEYLILATLRCNYSEKSACYSPANILFLLESHGRCLVNSREHMVPLCS